MGTVYVELGADAAREVARIRKELDKLDEVIAKLKAKLRSEAFRSKAPKEVVEKERVKLEELADKAERLHRNLAVLEQ